MHVKELMTSDLAYCTTGTNISDVAKMMVDCDCGAIPVVDSMEHRHPVGVVTDRDRGFGLRACANSPSLHLVREGTGPAWLWLDCAALDSFKKWRSRSTRSNSWPAGRGGPVPPQPVS